MKCARNKQEWIARDFDRVGHDGQDKAHHHFAGRRRSWRVLAGDRCPPPNAYSGCRKYLSATTWQVETLLREKIIPSFVLGKRRVVDRLELDRYVEWRNAIARTESAVPEKEEIVVSLKK